MARLTCCYLYGCSIHVCNPCNTSVLVMSHFSVLHLDHQSSKFASLCSLFWVFIISLHSQMHRFPVFCAMMTPRFILLVVASLCLLDIYNVGLLVHAQIIRFDCRKDGLFKLVARNTKLQGSQILLMTTSLVSLSQCAKLCVDKSLCMSLNYNPIATDCELLVESRNPIGNRTLSSISDWKHYEPVTRVSYLR